VSGGSFTAAYYGLYGDDIFNSYERRFLKQSIQGTLIRKLFNPVYWGRSMFSAFDRTEMAVDYYDTYIFRGATFKDLPHDKPPFIEINASDLNAGARFSFTQRYFDLICSDLDDFSVARAVTASSAVPLLFPSVVLENHSDQCSIDNTPIGMQIQNMDTDENAHQALRDTLASYRNKKERPYIHLVDGGITDNLGMRAIMDRLITFGYQPGANDPFTQFDHVAFIVVNAEVKPHRTIDQTAEKPGIAKTVDAVSAAQIAGFTLQTRQLLRRGINTQNMAAEEQGLPQKFHYIEISFQDVASRKLKDYLNNLPTSLELDSDQVDELIHAGRHLLRSSPEYQTLLNRLREQ
ncbi:MAG: patatin-like phospholipase family protein, partial [Gammaproteobacteria bacterium]